MSDNDKPSSASSYELFPVTTGFPSAQIPTVFVDGFLNVAPGDGIVKFYLYRTDPDQLGAPKFQNQVVAQIVMPISGFIHSIVFAKDTIKKLAANNPTIKAHLELAEKSYGPET